MRPADYLGCPAIARAGRPFSVRAGRAFHYQDDPCERAVLIAGGEVRPIKFASDGKPFDLPPLGPGRWLGLAEMLADRPYSFDALAAAPCEALAFPRAAVARLGADAGAAPLLLRALAEEVLWLQGHLADADAEGKLLSFLLARRRGPGGLERAAIATTQAQVAQALGLARETVNKLLRDLEEGGLVALARGEVAVRDWGALAARAAGRGGG